MSMTQLQLQSGKWLAANCGKFPSDNNCKVLLMAPEAQRSDLLEAAVDHAVKCHGHQDSKDLRNQLNQFLEAVDI